MAAGATVAVVGGGAGGLGGAGGGAGGLGGAGGGAGGLGGAGGGCRRPGRCRRRWWPWWGVVGLAAVVPCLQEVGVGVVDVAALEEPVAPEAQAVVVVVGAAELEAWAVAEVVARGGGGGWWWMREILRVGESDRGCRRTGDYAIKRGIIKLLRNEESAAHLIEMGHHVANGREKNIRIHDFHGINTTGVIINQGRTGKRQFAVARLPARGAIRIAGKNPAFIKQIVLTGSKKTAHAAYGIGHIRRSWIVGIETRRARRPFILRIEQQNVRRIHIVAVCTRRG